MSRSRKPSVFQIGKVRDDGHTVVISGWGLGLCAAGCACHRHPSAGHLAIAEDQAAILRDFRTVSSLQAQEPLAG